MSRRSEIAELTEELQEITVMVAALTESLRLTLEQLEWRERAGRTHWTLPPDHVGEVVPFPAS